MPSNTQRIRAGVNRLRTAKSAGSRSFRPKWSPGALGPTLFLPEVPACHCRMPARVYAFALARSSSLLLYASLRTFTSLQPSLYIHKTRGFVLAVVLSAAKLAACRQSSHLNVAFPAQIFSAYSPYISPCHPRTCAQQISCHLSSRHVHLCDPSSQPWRHASPSQPLPKTSAPTSRSSGSPPPTSIQPHGLARIRVRPNPTSTTLVCHPPRAWGPSHRIQKRPRRNSADAGRPTLHTGSMYVAERTTRVSAMSCARCAKDAWSRDISRG